MTFPEYAISKAEFLVHSSIDLEIPDTDVTPSPLTGYASSSHGSKENAFELLVSQDWNLGVMPVHIRVSKMASFLSCFWFCFIAVGTSEFLNLLIESSSQISNSTGLALGSNLQDEIRSGFGCLVMANWDRGHRDGRGRAYALTLGEETEMKFSIGRDID
ncbi:hypothetical protein TEA_026222 [Camellia sinensis var. sinensis]|uniref:Uncharacterized protein n=1 Tax=Camellia sinensis var. sinensis TaxID=542762 RepID=A0A4S4EM21_CAMSN|nr:hypothetical protein TEA_026222 [Camellia sinensis var. sinensis]